MRLVLNVVLISTYELGRQPFGLASPAAWLKNLGAKVQCQDLSVKPLEEESVKNADLIGIYVPMHTATRIVAKLLPRLKKLNPAAHYCLYGLYASVNESYLRSLGGHTILGGEFEDRLATLYQSLVNSESLISQQQTLPTTGVEKLDFIVPDRSSLPPLSDYAYLRVGKNETRVVGYTEASRGCKHRCRHCPVVPVYNGRFRIVPVDVVMDDIAQQVAAGAEHITFGDPDFLNGPTHAVAVVEALHERFPKITFDATIKIEHLVKHARVLPILKRSGCLFITSAVETIDPNILHVFDKGHTRADFEQAVKLCRELDLALTPTFVTFSPWTTISGYIDLLKSILDLDLIDNISPIQYAIRLLIPKGSRLMELQETRNVVGDFDEEKLVYPWRHPDPAVDLLFSQVMELVQAGQKVNKSRVKIFSEIWETAQNAYKQAMMNKLEPRKEAVIPQMSEAWYC